MAPGTQPCLALRDDQLCRIPGQLSDGPAIPRKIVRGALVGQGVVLCREPGIKSMIPWLGLCRQIKVSTQRPLPNTQVSYSEFRSSVATVTCDRITCIGEYIGIQLSIPIQNGVRPVIMPAVDASRSGPPSSNPSVANLLRRRRQYGESSARCLHSSRGHRIPGHLRG